jgi:hypothetical protein
MGDGAMEVTVKYGKEDLRVEVAGWATTVRSLKQQLEAATGLFVRKQKLIFKGKVLDDPATLEQCKVAAGAKLMLVVGQDGAAPSKVRAEGPALAVRGPPRARGDQQRTLACGAGRRRGGSARRRRRPAG